MLEITQSKGIHITFENGYQVSVQFGYGNYCENRNNREIQGEDAKSKDAEIAIFKNDNWATKEVWKELYNEELYDDVEGYLEANKIAELLYKVSQLQLDKRGNLLQAH